MRFPNPLTAAARYRDALTDPARADRAVLVSLVAYVVLWTIYATIAKGSQGLHYDMAEVIAWSRDLQFGYLKHPPLAAGIVWLWFSLFPVAEWSYYLLAMAMPAVALWFAWRLSADYLDIEKRVVGIALLTLIPFFNFHALKFNVNTVLIPLWAMTTFWFLRSFETRSRLYAALAGIGAAGCMLGKYWSVFLLAGLALAALIDNRRAVYFRSAAPWITIVSGVIVLAPHVIWLVQHDFAPFGYAMSIHGAKPFGATLISLLGYLGGSVGYIAIPLIIVLVASWPSRAMLADKIWPSEPKRRLAAAAFWGPFLLPMLGAVVSGTEITSLWSMPAWTLLPVLLLSSPKVTLRAIDTRRILIAAVAVPLAMLIAAPAIAVIVHRNGPPPAAAQGRLLAAQIEQNWHQSTPLPLRYVGGDPEIAYSIVAYAYDKPHALPGMPAPSPAQLKQSGMALVCFAEDTNCVSRARAHNPDGGVMTTEIWRYYWGMPGKPQRYNIVIVPPQQ
ncbi:MAG TPA: glycosyltransferase family 39 protein [Pseudolabrys sp.]|nr:glycosyltransferase family 39 protein [Pseudolabrys sp.]